METPTAVTVIKEEVGEGLRSVSFASNDYAPVYRRDDVDAQYLDEELDHIHDEYRSSRLSSPYLENIWKLGSHDCTVYVFSEGLVCHFIGERDELVVSVDLDSSINLLSLIKTCNKFV